MAKTYLALTNELLVELNEPEVSAVSDGVGIQKQVSNCVNRAYSDMVDSVDNWAWLSTAEPDDPYYGNTFINSEEGKRWYLLKAGSTSVDTDYDAVNWDAFTLSTEGVAGKSAFVPSSIAEWTKTSRPSASSHLLVTKAYIRFPHSVRSSSVRSIEIYASLRTASSCGLVVG